MPKAQDDDLIMSLVELALARPPEKREAYLRSECEGDIGLFGQVWAYVQWEDRMKGFLLDPLYSLQPPEPFEHPFQAGDVLLERFEIVREVAQGGMGIVYEALDQRLERRIAIKCAKAGFSKRLPPEVRHAREVTHPNVCKIFDVHTASTEHGDIDFLTMEFLDGETLAERLLHGRMPQEDARTIAAQLCAGLAEAHRNKVTHGDLKSSNIILTSNSDGGIRAVITDFGLARQPLPQAPPSTAPDSEYHPVVSGQEAGTPDYMAPELWKRQKPSPASDVYALGVILCELVCGRRPFAADLKWEDRLNRKPPAMHPKWDRVFVRCLDPDPAHRFRDAQELARALEPPRIRPLWIGAAAAMVAAAATGTVTYQRVSAPKESVRLAVLPFEADSTNKVMSNGLLGSTADQLLHVKRGSTQRLTVIPFADALKNKIDTREKAVGMLGATHILTGTFQRDGSRVHVRAHLTDARSGLPLKDWNAEYAVDELQNMPVALAGMVTGALRLPPLVAVATVNGAAYADFVRGVGLVQINSVDQALPLLESASRADPNSPLTYARLAEAQHLKYQFIKDMKGTGGEEWQQKAKASLARAELLNPDVTAVRTVSGMINKYAGNYENAEADYRRALEIEPQDGDTWRRLGDLHQEMSHFPEAIAAYQKAVEVQPGYFKNYEALCYLYSDQANFDEALRQCKKAVDLVPKLSEAHYSFAKPYVAAGNYDQGESEVRTALDLDPKSSRALAALAVVLLYRHRYTEAIPKFVEAAAIGPETEILYLNLGMAYRLAGLPQNARDAYTRSMQLAEAELSRNLRDRMLRSHLAYLCAHLGQRDRAEFEALEALQISNGSVEVKRMIVQTYLAMGEVDRAVALAATLPDESLRRLNRSPDLADISKDSRFQDLMQSRHIQ